MKRVPGVDADCCIGCEVCTQICPEVFRMTGDDHHSHSHGHEHKSEVYNPGGEDRTGHGQLPGGLHLLALG